MAKGREKNYRYYTLLEPYFKFDIPMPHTLPRYIQETLVSLRCSSTYMTSCVHTSWKDCSEVRAKQIQLTVSLKIMEGFK